MKCPFELPVEPHEELLMLHINGKLRASLFIGDVDDWDNEKRLQYLRYIVHAINSHEKLKTALQKVIDDHPAGLHTPTEPASLAQARQVLEEVE